MALETQKSVSTEDVSLDRIFQEDEQTVYNICKVCMGYNTCTFPIDLSRPILHCAEFKPYPPRQVSIRDKDDALTRMSEKLEQNETSEYTGLCKNCELRQKCIYAKSGKLILNCEEYQ